RDSCQLRQARSRMSLLLPADARPQWPTTQTDESSQSQRIPVPPSLDDFALTEVKSTSTFGFPSGWLAHVSLNLMRDGWGHVSRLPLEPIPVSSHCGSEAATQNN